MNTWENQGRSLLWGMATGQDQDHCFPCLSYCVLCLTKTISWIQIIRSRIDLRTWHLESSVASLGAFSGQTMLMPCVITPLILCFRCGINTSTQVERAPCACGMYAFVREIEYIRCVAFGSSFICRQWPIGSSFFFAIGSEPLLYRHQPLGHRCWSQVWDEFIRNLSIILLKYKSKCVFTFALRARSSHINQKIRKKKDLDHLFYIKSFRRFIFNLFKLIWIWVRSSPIWNKTKSHNTSET
jgi:hypothetical protein